MRCFAIVQHQERGVWAEVPDHRSEKGRTGRLTNTQRPGHRFHDQLFLRNRGELDEPDATDALLGELGRHPQGEPRLPYTTHTGECHQAPGT